MTANKAMAQGWIAARHALGEQVDPFRQELVLEAVYAEPDVAQVGVSEASARTEGRQVRILRRGFGDNLKARLLGQPEGLLKLVVDSESGVLLGGAAVGSHAADVLAPLAAALGQGGSVRDLKRAFPGHPTLGELLFDLARES